MKNATNWNPPKKFQCSRPPACPLTISRKLKLTNRGKTVLHVEALPELSWLLPPGEYEARAVLVAREGRFTSDPVTITVEPAR